MSDLGNGGWPNSMKLGGNINLDELLLDPSFICLYYIDTSVLLKNIPLVKFIKTTSRTRVVYFP